MKATLCLLAALPASAAFAGPAACPAATEQFSEYLASAKQRIGFEGEVRVEFEVGADGRARLRQLQGSRQYLGPVRNAVDALECQGGAPQRYVLNIRFAEPPPHTMAAASATLAQARAASANNSTTPR